VCVCMARVMKSSRRLLIKNWHVFLKLKRPYSAKVEKNIKGLKIS